MTASPFCLLYRCAVKNHCRKKINHCFSKPKALFLLTEIILNYINMEISHIEHIGIAVENLEEAIAWYEEKLGLTCYAIEEITDQKVRTAFFKVGQTKLELLESTDPDGPIGKFIAKKGPGLHHLAFAVDDVESALQTVAGRGVDLIDKSSRQGAENLRIGFLHPKSTFGVLTELCGSH
jgi:methylmalonyl-CoA/ethylmalonyl-CoA epimerase